MEAQQICSALEKKARECLKEAGIDNASRTLGWLSGLSGFTCDEALKTYSDYTKRFSKESAKFWEDYFHLENYWLENHDMQADISIAELKSDMLSSELGVLLSLAVKQMVADGKQLTEYFKYNTKQEALVQLEESVKKYVVDVQLTDTKTFAQLLMQVSQLPFFTPYHIYCTGSGHCRPGRVQEPKQRYFFTSHVLHFTDDDLVNSEAFEDTYGLINVKHEEKRKYGKAIKQFHEDLISICFGPQVNSAIRDDELVCAFNLRRGAMVPQAHVLSKIQGEYVSYALVAEDDNPATLKQLWSLVFEVIDRYTVQYPYVEAEAEKTYLDIEFRKPMLSELVGILGRCESDYLKIRDEILGTE